MMMMMIMMMMTMSLTTDNMAVQSQLEHQHVIQGGP